MDGNIIVAGAVGTLLCAILLVKLNILAKKYFQLIFNIIFFVYAYLCITNNYMNLARGGMMIYGGAIIYYWIKEKK